VPATVPEILGPGGPVAARMRAALGASGYEHRPEQVRMGEAIAAALESRNRLLVEAGTGVGKSFAYLVPAILRCLQRGEKVVIATSTIALQEQLMSKDIPLLMETLAQWNIGPSTAASAAAGVAPVLLPVLAKGRGNYLSVRRLGQASKRADLILPDAEARASLMAIESWAYSTKDGTLTSLPVLQRPEVWDHVRSDTDNCLGRKCPTYEQCFYQSARKELEKANLIVCNHALFFSDLALRTRHAAAAAASVQDDTDPTAKPSSPKSGVHQIKAILPNYDHVIFDEAHGLEDAACEHFGLSLSMPRVMRLLRTLHSPRRRRGYLLEKSLAIGNAGVVDRALTLVHHAEHACTQFFEDLLQFWRQSGPGGGRMRQADLIDNPLSTAMAELALVLRRIRDGIEDPNERLELETGDSAYAYWVEVEGDRPTGTPPPRGGDPDDDHDDAATFGPTPQRRFGPRVTLACAPIEVAQILRAYLFDPKRETEELPLDVGDFDVDSDQAPTPAAAPKPAAPKRIGIILTSATLATRAAKLAEDNPDAPSSARPDSAFAHITKNLGVVAPTTLQLGSPFDYRRQAKVIVDLTVPDPKQTRTQSSGARSFNDALADRILHHLRSTRGGAFVLFTSFATMHASADRLRSSLAREGWPLFVQGRDGSRQAILKKFVQEDDGVLFGAASFWQGVDVRGDRLRNVIITRLPFEPPDRPLVQARNERIELTGGNPFMHDSLPRAIIRFKQGFGRLIRSKSDRGQVVVLDPRIVTARYGRMFLSALPEGLPTQVIKPGVDEFDDAIEVIPEPF
jgi:ATP-dependent DNA helicase DinG